MLSFSITADILLFSWLQHSFSILNHTAQYFHLAKGYFFFPGSYCPVGLTSDRNSDPCCEPSPLLADAAGGLGT